MTITVAELAGYVGELYPYAWAEPWDRVGLLAGDPSGEVAGVFVSLDPTGDALDRAKAAGADVLLTHHPAALEMPASLTPGHGPGGVLFKALSLGIALVAAHTNLDRAPEGAESLPLAAGLVPGEPLERGRQAVSLVTVFVPRDAAGALVAAMTAAGAGRIGRYEGAAFVAEGTGTFVPLAGATPAVGRAGAREHAEETRVEMVCDPAVVPGVLAAARAAHPYEEPVTLVSSVELDRGAARLGRLCALPEPIPLRAFAAEAGRRLGVRPRVWGDPDRTVALVATCSGSGGSLVESAVAARASVLLTGEVRYHVALEALAAGLAVVEAGHDATEWPHVPVMASGLRRHPDLADRVVEDTPVVHWWTS